MLALIVAPIYSLERRGQVPVLLPGVSPGTILKFPELHAVLAACGAVALLLTGLQGVVITLLLPVPLAVLVHDMVQQARGETGSLFSTEVREALLDARRKKRSAEPLRTPEALSGNDEEIESGADGTCDSPHDGEGNMEGRVEAIRHKYRPAATKGAGSELRQRAPAASGVSSDRSSSER